MTWLDKARKADILTSDARNQVAYVRNLCYDVGLNRLAEELWRALQDIDAAAELYQDAHSQVVNDMLLMAEQSSVNMVNAALAGITISKEKE